MRKTLALSLAAALLSLSAAAAADEPASKGSTRALGVESSITFPNSATIKNWRADGENGLWVQDRKGDWYYGKFAVICRNADFALAIGIDNRGTSTLDRFATVIVGRERCPLISFVSSAPPPTKAELKAKREAEKAAKSN
ncbi:MAG: DUF6491 family protein [Sphingopyxis sp.]